MILSQLLIHSKVAFTVVWDFDSLLFDEFLCGLH